jgi:hypothetical protein
MLGARGDKIMLRFFSIAFRTISAGALVLLAIAVAPTVATAFAHTRPAISDAASLDQPVADQACAAFEAWFLDPACSNKGHAKKAARAKHRLAHNAVR